VLEIRGRRLAVIFVFVVLLLCWKQGGVLVRIEVSSSSAKLFAASHTSSFPFVL